MLKFINAVQNVMIQILCFKIKQNVILFPFREQNEKSTPIANLIL